MIRFDRVSKQFKGVQAVCDLSLELRAGETIALIGPNGSGKSTTLKLAVGLVHPTSGVVTINGRANDARARAQLGYLPQQLAFPEGASAAQLISLYAKLRRATPDVPAVLDLVGLGEVGTRAAGTFSGGMKQRLGLAIALLGDPDTLVLDEPTAALDPTGAIEVRELIAQIKARGKSVLISSHDLNEVAVLADRIAIFNAGRLTALGSLPELAAHYGAASTEEIYRAVTGMERRAA